MTQILAPLLKTALRRFPLLSGRGTLVQSPFLKGLRIDGEKMTVSLPNDYAIVVFPNDYVGRSAYYFGDIDPKVTATLHKLLDKGDTLVDIGANIGLTSLLCHPRVGPSGRIVAVEPQPSCCQAFAESLEINGLSNVEIHRVALSSAAGRAAMHLGDPDNLGTAQLGAGSVAIPGVGEVEVRQAGEFLESLNLQGHYVVKIDVEGHEGDVVFGCREFWNRRPPRAVVFESTTHLHRRGDFQDSPAYATLHAAGYRILQIHKTLWALRYTEVPAEGPIEATDFVAVRPDDARRLA